MVIYLLKSKPPVWKPYWALVLNIFVLFLAYWVAEDKDVPARVTLLEIPSRNEVRVKNLFNVADCKMHWQKTGDYLCVKVSL